MRFAFCLFKYFPYGGLERNFLRIAEVCLSRHHTVDVFTTSWQGDTPPGLKVAILSPKGFTNHRRRQSLADQLRQIVAKSPYDAVVGFYKMPGLDIYYAADPCLAAKASIKGFLYRNTRRYKTYLCLEKAVFNKRSKTEILLIAEKQKSLFMKFYGTPEHRFHFLPPGISRDRVAPHNFAEIRAELRSEFRIEHDRNIVLMVGSDYKRKGVDRAIRAMAALSSEVLAKTILLVAGKGKKKPFQRLARKLGISSNVIFLGARDDIPSFLVASDLLLHPAYSENTGTVLIEALASGLPVLATAVCGYSHHVERAAAGKIVPSPFKQETLNQLLLYMLTSDQKKQWQLNAKAYVARTDVFSRAEKAADVIEKVAARRKRRPQQTTGSHATIHRLH